MKKIDRILQYIEDQKIDIAEFERNNKISNAYFANTRKREADVTNKILDRIRNNQPEIYFAIFAEDLTSEHRNKHLYVTSNYDKTFESALNNTMLTTLKEEVAQYKIHGVDHLDGFLALLKNVSIPQEYFNIIVQNYLNAIIENKTLRQELSNYKSITTQIRELADLKEDGLLTEEEFNHQKAKLLS